jgi:hypothetical protein
MTTLAWVVHLFTVGFYVFADKASAEDWLEDNGYVARPHLNESGYRTTLQTFWLESARGNNVGTLAQAKEHNPLAIPPVPQSRKHPDPRAEPMTHPWRINFYNDSDCKRWDGKLLFRVIEDAQDWLAKNGYRKTHTAPATYTNDAGTYANIKLKIEE